MSKPLLLSDIGLPGYMIEELATLKITTLDGLLRQNFHKLELPRFNVEKHLTLIVDDARDDLLQKISMKQLLNTRIAVKSKTNPQSWHITYGARLLFGHPLALRGHNVIEKLGLPTLKKLSTVTFKQMTDIDCVGKKSAEYVLGRLKALAIIDDPEVEPTTKPVIYKQMPWAELMAKHPKDLIDIDEKNSILLCQSKIFTILELISLTEQELREVGITLKQIKSIKSALKPYGAYLKTPRLPDWVYLPGPVGLHT